ncbi:MAG: hypothetical protein NTV63_02180 [Candidatus Woesearchaeota archaeon]|nr:hypothetical protein [Candidatus Woesearchaeota archaeon]
MSSKRAEMQSQIFIYITTALIIGLTILFGYKAISTMREGGSKAEVLQFKKAIANEINSLSYGESKEYLVQVPSGYEACFVNLLDIDSPDIDTSSFLQESAGTTGKNIFLVTIETGVAEPIATTKEILAESTFCMKSPGRIIIENMGKEIIVTKK